MLRQAAIRNAPNAQAKPSRGNTRQQHASNQQHATSPSSTTTRDTNIKPNQTYIAIMTRSSIVLLLLTNFPSPSVQQINYQPFSDERDYCTRESTQLGLCLGMQVSCSLYYAWFVAMTVQDWIYMVVRSICCHVKSSWCDTEDSLFVVCTYYALRAFISFCTLTCQMIDVQIIFVLEQHYRIVK